MNKTMFNETCEVLCFEPSGIRLVAVIPNRENIFYDIIHQRSYDFSKDLQWVVDRLTTEKSSCGKILIFANSIKMVSDIYIFLMNSLGRHAYQEGIIDVKKRYVSMYHGHIGKDFANYTIEEFTKTNSTIRILVATIAFGMGIDIGDLHTVVHYGKCQSVVELMQEFGRCGRDGKKSVAIWYPALNSKSDDKSSEVFRKLKTDKTTCIRFELLKELNVNDQDVSAYNTQSKANPCAKRCISDCTCELCCCCSHCRAQCMCEHRKFFVSEL